MPRSVVSWCCWGPSLPHWWLSGSPRAPRETAAYGPSWVACCGGACPRAGTCSPSPTCPPSSSPPRFGDEPWYLILGAIAVSTPFQAGEEIGWRGYALPRLAARFGLARASILLGLIWGSWHMPQFFIPEADTYGQSFVVYVLQVTALSVAMAWLYARTNGSLLLVMLLHSAVNNTKDIVPSALPGANSTFGLSASLVAWLTVTLLWICAGYFLVTMRRQADTSSTIV